MRPLVPLLRVAPPPGPDVLLVDCERTPTELAKAVDVVFLSLALGREEKTA